jgi:LysR family transcriptional regulator for bpeEF and oprC
VDRLDLFKVFVCVVESASFARAAESMGMPRSSVSVAIRDLEARVGVRLLQRTTRKVAPTQDGIALYDRALRLIADFEETEVLFRSAPAAVSGRIRIDVPSRIGRLIVAPVLPEFLQRFPEVDVVLGSTDRAVDLVEEGIDCVLRVGGNRDPRLIARPLGELGIINVASPEYLRRHGIPRSPDNLGEHWAVNYASPASGRVEEWEWMEGRTPRSCAVRARVTVNNAETYIACCLAGMGLIQVPAYDVAAHVAAGELVEVMPEYRAQSMPMSLLYPQNRHLSRRLQIFAQWLEQVVTRHAV